MSLQPMLWAMKAAPVADTTEKLILISLAERAHEDGTDAFPSKGTLAQDALCDEKTVGRKLTQLRKRGLIGFGDQRAARHIPAQYRPKVYDLLIPYSWFPSVETVNEGRSRLGRPPLRPEDRPDIAAAPPRRARSDKGVPRPKKKPGGGLSVPPADDRRGGTLSPVQGGLSVP